MNYYMVSGNRRPSVKNNVTQQYQSLTRIYIAESNSGASIRRFVLKKVNYYDKQNILIFFQPMRKPSESDES